MKQSLEYLPHDGSDVVDIHCGPFSIEVLFHVQVEIFEDEVKFILTMYNVDQVNNAWMIELAKQRHFSDGCARDPFIAVLNLNFLQSDCLKVRRKHVRIFVLKKWRVYPYLIIGQIDSLENEAIRSFSKLFDDLEPPVAFLELFLGMSAVVHICENVLRWTFSAIIRAEILSILGRITSSLWLHHLPNNLRKNKN